MLCVAILHSFSQWVCKSHVAINCASSSYPTMINVSCAFGVCVCVVCVCVCAYMYVCLRVLMC